MSRSIEIVWNAIGQEKFDQIVNALLRRRYVEDPDRKAQPIDGRGGDQGKDCVVLYRGTIETIYQYKYFPEGFSGDWRSRRTQIKRSFKSAMKHKPKRWILVIPRNPTTSEIAFVDKLAEGHDVEVDIEGEAALDTALAENLDLARYFTEDPVRELLSDVGRPELMLDNPERIHDAIAGVQRQVNARNPYWGINFSVDERGITQTPYAKDPDAPSIEPILLNVRVGVASANYAAFEKLWQYGDVDGVLVLDDSEHEHFEIQGPDLVAQNGDGRRLEISKPPIPLEHQKPVEFRVVDEDGHTVASVIGKGIYAARGSHGGTLKVEFPGGMHMKFTIPDDMAVPGGATMNWHPVGQDAIAVHRERRAVETAMHRSNYTELWIGSKRRTRWQTNDAIFSGFNDGDQKIAEDLAIISKLLEVALTIPEQLTVAERREIRELRLLLDGYCILMPEINGATVTVENAAREMLADLVHRKGGVRFAGPLEFTIQSHALVVEEVYLFHPAAQLVNKEEVLAALEDPDTELFTLKLESADDTPFRAFNPRLVPNPDSYMLPTPLEIEGIQEHPAIALIAERWEADLESPENEEEGP
ncbi:hypothetical protein AB0B28_06365 [Glycomyces sp. NPDC046736]|uniref:hypothetical protein n=1 Tax=Glycomyces sp. NPDC046736 TaxID=3155615 RepID=UPI0033E024FC